MGGRGPPRVTASRFPRSGRARCNLLRALLDALGEVLALLAAAFLHGFGQARRGFFPDELAPLDSLGASLRRAVLDVVGQRAHALVLGPRRRSDDAYQEADRRAGNRKPQRILLGDARGLPGAPLHGLAVRDSAPDRGDDGVSGTGHLAHRGVLLLAE